MAAVLPSARARARAHLPSTWFLLMTLLFVCQCLCSPALFPSPSSTMDPNQTRTTLSDADVHSRAAPTGLTPSNAVTVAETTQPFLPVPTDVHVLFVNATAVCVQWSFNFSAVHPPSLRTALNFAVNVIVAGHNPKVITVPGNLTHLLFTEVIKFYEYTFRVTAQSGDTASQPSQPTDTLVGALISCTLPTNLRVVAVEKFRVSLAWDQSTCESRFTEPLYFVKYGSTPDDMGHTLFTGGLTLDIQNVKPEHDYYFCVGVQYLLPSVCSETVHTTTPSVDLPQPGALKTTGGLRSITITWVPPPLTTIGVAVIQYNLYYMPGPASDFDQKRAQREMVQGEETHLTLDGLKPAAEYSMAVTYLVAMKSKPPSFWELESPASRVATAHSVPDAQSFSIQCSQCKALSPEVLRIFWQVEPSPEGHSSLHMTLHISDVLSHRPVGRSEEWAGGHFDVGGLSPWSTHQYELQLEDSLGYKGRNFTCQKCRTLEEAPSAAPNHLSVRLYAQSYYASWQELPETQQNGQLEYQVLLYHCPTGANRSHLPPAAECGRCVQQSVPTYLTTTHTSISLQGATHLGTSYAVQVRGLTGQGSLKGPLSPPACFTTPEGAPNQAPSVHYSIVLGQAVCVEWDAPVRGLQSGAVLGYLVAVSEGQPAGDPASFHRHEVNLTDPASLHYLLSGLRDGLAYNITVQAYSRAGSGPTSDRISVQPMQLERSRSDVGLKATHDSNVPCSTVTISWAEQRGACGSYSNVLEYYIANDSSTIRSIPVPPNATYLKLTAKEFSPETEYEFRLKVSYTSVDGDTLRESTSDPAQLYIPYCQQVLDHVLITVLAILMAVMAVTILGTLLTLLCCHYRCTRISRRRLQNTPRYLQRIRRRQNPYIQYPVHHEGSPHLTASPPLSVLSEGSDGDDLPLRLSPSPEQDLGSYVPLPFNNSQLDSFTRSLSPIAMQEIRQLADKGKSPPPSARPPSMAGTCKGAPQKRRRPIGQSSTTVYGDSSSSDNDNDSDSDASDDVLLQT